MTKYVITSVQSQRSFTVRLPGMSEMRGRYYDRLRILHLESLELRRLHIDLQYVYKIYYGLTDLDFSAFFARNSSSARGNCCKLFQPALHRNLACRRHYFTNRIIPVWNSLPNEVVLASSLEAFKRELSKFSFDNLLHFSGSTV